MATVVVFSDTGVRIYEGVSAADYAGRKDALINPAFPRHVPPHLWELSNGKIEGSLEVVTVKKDYTYWKYLGFVLLGASLTFIAFHLGR